MKKRQSRPFGILTLSRRLFKIAGAQKWPLIHSTLASVFDNFAHLGLMASGALLIFS
jgi:hypothetical protein